MMSHDNVTSNDRIVLVMTVLASLALIGAAAGGLGGHFFGGILKDLLGSLLGGGGLGDILKELIGSLF